MGKDELNEIAKIDDEIHKLEIIYENVFNQLKKLKEKRKFYELLP